jgi:hypothetical protein
MEIENWKKIEGINSWIIFKEAILGDYFFFFKE